MYPTRRIILCLLWCSVSATFLASAPSLPAGTPATSDAATAVGSAAPLAIAMDPSVGEVGLPSKPDPIPREPAASGQPAARPANDEPAAGTAEAGTYLLARSVGGLGLVIGLILLGYVAVRRFGPKYLRRPGAQGSLKVIETLSIGEKRSVALIQVEDKRLLIGNTQQQITLLAQLPWTTDAAIEPGREPLPKSTPGTVASFRRLYEVEKGGQPALPQAKAIPQDLRDKMRQLREALET